MKSLNEAVKEYRKQIEKGDIREAYQGLMECMMGLRSHFEKKHPDSFVSGSLYFGTMDMTYFSFIPESLKRKKLKIAIVLVHDTVRFEVWLAGFNKRIQAKYWTFFKESGWNKYRLPPTIKGADSILESVLVDAPDFDDGKALTRLIEKGTLSFTKDVVDFLHKNPF